MILNLKKVDIMRDFEITQPVILIGVEPIKVQEVNRVVVNSNGKIISFKGATVKLQLINHKLVIYVEDNESE
tara:strand:- start:34 stop:249 length:216 start_codon:yes stop_codon:yes gene_type:complete